MQGARSESTSFTKKHNWTRLTNLIYEGIRSNDLSWADFKFKVIFMEACTFLNDSLLY